MLFRDGKGCHHSTPNVTQTQELRGNKSASHSKIFLMEQVRSGPVICLDRGQSAGMGCPEEDTD